MAEKKATQNEGADDKKPSAEEIIKKQGPRPRDEFATFVAGQHRAQRDEALKEDQKSKGIENPVVPDTLNLKKDEEYEKPKHPDQIQMEQAEELAKKEADEAAAKQAEEAKKAEEAKPKEEEKAGKTKEDQPAEEMVEITVYGEKSMVPKSEVDAAGGQVIYQKLKAAEYQLEKAKKVLENAQQTSAQSQQKPTQDQSGGKGGPVSVEDIQETVRAMQEGTEEEGVKALQKLLSQVGGSSKSNDPQELVSLVNDRLAYDAAMTVFKTKYPAIMADPKLVEMVRVRDNELRGDPNETRGYEERYLAIGEEITNWVSSFGGGTANTEQVLADKQQRKENADPEPKAASARSVDTGAAVNQPPSRKSPRDVVNQMRVSRGQS